MAKMKKLTPLRAIRAKCIDCWVGNSAEVRRCETEDCSLWQYRFGKNPSRSGMGPKNPKFTPKSGVESRVLETK